MTSEDTADKALLDGRILIGATQAGRILGVSPRTFTRRHERGLYPGLRHVRTLRGRLFSMIEILKTAFPGANDEIIYKLAADHIKDRNMAKRRIENEDTKS